MTAGGHEIGRGPLTTVVMRYSGLGRLATLLEYFAFDLPRTTTAAGVTLMAGLAAAHAYLIDGGTADPAYLNVYRALIVTGSLVAIALMSLPGPARAGWRLGSLVSVVALAVYLASRTAGLPGMPLLAGRWDCPLGTVTMGVAALFLALHGSVLTGVNVAYPRRRDWYD
ncbi:oxidoreductase [Microbispora sp. H13382]|uniref:oxidoreductase n=1 Tax=Microbispora sp. H13382 TaxID=2729112 RepID=UPI0016022724|nr:oxidoreductase [Microbispora sp. H13382]